MSIYRTIDEVFEDRRKGIKLSEVIENILHSPYILSQIDTPFDVVGGLNRGDYLDMSTEAWGSLPVELQIKYATAYQAWYAYHSGHPSVEGTFDLITGSETKMRLIPPGKYRMGSPKEEIGRYSDEKQRVVLIKKAFWCGATSVTQNEWINYPMGMNPSEFKGELKPVTNVSFEECQEFCERVGMYLPTEEQWEYACRAGTTTAYSFGDDISKLSEYAVYGRRYVDGPAKVKSKKSNAWGLYDMHGNVWEWTNSLYKESSNYVSRSASWFNRVDNRRSAFRYEGHNSLYRWDDLGLRICRSV